MLFAAKARLAPCTADGTPNLAQSFEVQFNPNQLAIQEAVGSYAYPDVTPPMKVPLKTEDTTQKLPSNRERLTLTARLLFHTYRSALDYDDVRVWVNRLHPFFNVNPQEKELHHISFSWGSIQVYGLLTDMNVTYGMFAADGTPVRAEVGITITGSYRGEERLNPGGIGTAAAAAVFNAAAVAAAGPDGWKEIAHAAGIVNPRTGSRE